jgi:hypothetical protein
MMSRIASGIGADVTPTPREAAEEARMSSRQSPASTSEEPAVRERHSAGAFDLRDLPGGRFHRDGRRSEVVATIAGALPAESLEESTS